MALFLVGLSLLGELTFVFVMGHPAVFTSFWAACFFCAMAGFVPLQPSPSRISTSALKLTDRLLLLAEWTVFVLLVFTGSTNFLSSRHIHLPVDTLFMLCSYMVVLIVMGAANFKKLKQEAYRARL